MDPWPLSEKVQKNLQIIVNDTPVPLPKKVRLDPQGMNVVFSWSFSVVIARKILQFRLACPPSYGESEVVTRWEIAMEMSQRWVA